MVKILLLLREAGYFSDSDECLLLAPTGKAADRLSQSIAGGLDALGIDATEFPTAASTIHRALGYRPGSIEFAHDAQNPLGAKVVVVDETSMVDLPLMSRLIAALGEDARAILIGDKYQLTSVQVGNRARRPDGGRRDGRATAPRLRGHLAEELPDTRAGPPRLRSDP